MKAAALVLMTLLMLSGQHVTLWCAGANCSVPLPVIAAVVICAALAGLTWLIVRAVIRDGFGLIPAAYWSVTP